MQLSTDEPVGQFRGYPRWQSGSNPQHLIVTIFGDFWLSRPEHLPSAALIRLLADLDVSLPSARASLARLTRRGVTTSRKQGRHTFYRLADPVARDAVLIGSAIMSLGADRPWSGQWTLCMFSLPESRRETRNRVRLRLKLLGFAPVYDGVWASPLKQIEGAAAVLDELGVSDGSVFASVEHHAAGGAGVRSAWKLDELRQHYDDFLREWSWVPDVLESGLVSPKEAFVIRTLMTDSYRRFLKLDPALPHELLPGAWPGGAARDLFGTSYDGLAALAELRVRQVVGDQSSEIASLVHTHTTGRFRQGGDGVRTCPKCLHFDHWAIPGQD
jgi:phenylacetic acid degradation operon negative regulatory protein